MVSKRKKPKRYPRKRWIWYEGLNNVGLQIIKLKEAESLFNKGKHKKGLEVYHRAVNKIIWIIDVLDKKLRSEVRGNDE